MGCGENKKIRLQPGHFFETYLGPVQRGIDNGDRPSAEHGISDESILADGDQRLGPNGEEHTLWWQGADAALQVSETALHVGGYEISCFGGARTSANFLEEEIISSTVWGPWHTRKYQDCQRMNGLKPVQALGHENEVRMQSGDLFQAGVDRATDFGFFLSVKG